MPLYDFECLACGAVSEILVRSSDTEVTCPSCGKGELRRRISAPAVLVKGGAPAASGSSCSRSSCAGCTSRCPR